MISLSYLRYFALNLMTAFLWFIVSRYAYLLDYDFACITAFVMGIVDIALLVFDTKEFVDEIREFIENYDIEDIENEDKDDKEYKE